MPLSSLYETVNGTDQNALRRGLTPATNDAGAVNFQGGNAGQVMPTQGVQAPVTPMINNAAGATFAGMAGPTVMTPKNTAAAGGGFQNPIKDTLSIGSAALNNPVTNTIGYGVDQGTKLVGDKTGLPGISGNPINNFSTMGGTVQASNNLATGQETPMDFVRGLNASPVNTIGYAGRMAGVSIPTLYDQIQSSAGQVNKVLGGALDRAPSIPSGVSIPGIGGGGGAGGGGAGSPGGGAGTSTQAMMGAADAYSANIGAQSQGVMGRTQGQADGLIGRAQQAIAAPAQVSGQFGVGQRLPTGPAPVAPGNVAGRLPGVRDVTGAQSVAGQLGAAPQVGNVGGIAGQLGQGPQVGNVGGIAGRLGGAPQVGNVGNVSTGSAPGAVMPQLGNFGQQNAQQQGMLGRVNSFLDASQGPSIAEAQLQQAQANNMGALIGAARSGRGGAGSQAQALRGAMSEGSAVMSDTAGQMATLRAQEEDMRKNRDLSAIGLGGNLATAQRQQDLGFRGQDLGALQGDQSAALGARGQDLTANLANQSTQTALEGLRAQTALGARGQDLGALQGDQSTALGLEGLRAQTGVATRGQNLSALQGDQGTALGLEGLRASTALGARGQNLGALQTDAGNQLAAQQLGVQRDLGVSGQNLQALQGDQATQLGFQGLNVQNQLGLRGQDVATRGQDLSALTGDADRSLAGQQLGVQRELGLTNAGLTAQGQGLQYGLGTQGQQLGALGEQAGLYNADQQRGLEYARLDNELTPEQKMEFAMIGAGGQAVGGLLSNPAIGAWLASDERAKTDITPLESVKRAATSPVADLHRKAKGYQYRYKAGVGEDTDAVHWGPMAQDLEKSPVGRSLVKTLPTGLKVVDTRRLALTNHAGLSEMRSELDGLRKLLRAS